MTVDDDGGHVELTQPGTERDATLSAADHQHVRLDGAAQLGVLGLALLGPRPRIRVVAVHRTQDTVGPLGLLVTLEFLKRGQQRPGFVRYRITA